MSSAQDPGADASVASDSATAAAAAAAADTTATAAAADTTATAAAAAAAGAAAAAATVEPAPAAVTDAGGASPSGDAVAAAVAAARGGSSGGSRPSRRRSSAASGGGGGRRSTPAVAVVPAAMLELRDIEPNAVQVARRKPAARPTRFKLLQRDFNDIAAAAGVRVGGPASDDDEDEQVGEDARQRRQRPHQQQQQQPQSPANTRKVLDGFFLLQAGKVEFPEEVTRLVVQHKNLGTVAAEDLPYFSNLKFLDASDNHLGGGASGRPLEKFGHLPALFELRLRDNDVSAVAGDCSLLKQLEVLDLSFNLLTEDAVVALGAIPRLRKLDLSGNNLHALPADMRKLRKLQELNLSSNFLKDPGVVMRLADMPRLRELDLENNLLRSFPADCTAADFPHLEWLNLARNSIETEFDIGGLVELKRLNHLVIFGNPLTDDGGGDGDDDDAPFLDHVTLGDRTIRITCEMQEPDAAEPLKDMYRTASRTGKFGPAKVSGQEWKQRGNARLFGGGAGAGNGGAGAGGEAGKASSGGRDGEDRDIDWAAQYEDKAVLHPPSGIVQLSAGKLHAAIVELREMLNHPVNYDPRFFLRNNFAKASESSARKAKPRVAYRVKPPKQASRRSNDRERRAEKQTLSRIEGMLDKMALSDDDAGGGTSQDEEGGEMFATEIGGGLGGMGGGGGGFTYTDATRGMAEAFQTNILDV